MIQQENEIITIIKNLPQKPGVYQFLDKSGDIIYIGKAKNIRKRVSSYFNKSTKIFKTEIMVKHISDIKTIIVNGESEALLLENSLIKEFQPKYNVQLKDDKTFPWICISNEPFPKVFKTRSKKNDGSLYYGPYTSVVMVNTLLELIRKIYPLRTCKYSLSKENIESKKIKVCLEYHLGNCLAPCVGKQTMEEYHLSIENIKSILNGDLFQVMALLKKQMKQLSENYQYEKAQIVKDKIFLLEKHMMKSTVVNTSFKNLDVCSIIEEDNKAYLNYLKIVNGAILFSHNVEIIRKIDEPKDELLMFVLTDIRLNYGSKAKEVILPFRPNIIPDDLKIIVPQRGPKRRLLELSEQNAKYFKFERRKKDSENIKVNKTSILLENIKKDLQMKYLPRHIECFDNSNIQGSIPVAACVVFKDLVPKKSEYRHFNIKTVSGIDDFASMKEVVYRRYKRILENKDSVPDLIIIDGGKGQLNAAAESLRELNLLGNIKLISIAKKLEEIFFVGDPVPLYIDKNSSSLKMIQKIRDEAHRFGITFHKSKRSKKMLSSFLDNVPGIGEKTKSLLYNEYKTLENISHSKTEDMEKLIGPKKTKALKQYLKQL